MTPNTFHTEAAFKIGDAFLLVLTLLIMLAPYLVSVVANIGRRQPMTRRAHVRPRAMLASPPRKAA